MDRLVWSFFVLAFFSSCDLGPVGGVIGIPDSDHSPKIENVIATNGIIKIKLREHPAVWPAEDNFMPIFTQRVDGASPVPLAAKFFRYDFPDAVQFTFSRFPTLTVEQTVILGVKLGTADEVFAPPLTIPPVADAEIESVSAGNNWTYGTGHITIELKETPTINLTEENFVPVFSLKINDEPPTVLAADFYSYNHGTTVFFTFPSLPAFVSEQTVTIGAKIGDKPEVYTPVFTIEASPPIINFAVDDVYILEKNSQQRIYLSSIVPSGASPGTLIWTSQNEEVVTVSAAGLMTAVKEGKTAITVSTTGSSTVKTITVVVVTRKFSLGATGDILTRREIIDHSIILDNANLFSLHYRCGGESNSNYAKNTVVTRFFDNENNIMHEDVYSFDSTSSYGGIKYTLLRNVTLSLPPSKLSKLSAVEIILDAGDYRAGISDTGYSFLKSTDDYNSNKRLQVNGPYLEYGSDGNFSPVTLRGLNLGDLYHFKEYSAGLPDFTHISGDLNSNCVRIAIHPSFWISNKAAVLQDLKENVRKALNANLFVVVDYHTIGFPGGYAASSSGPADYSSDFNTAKDFWDTVSGEIKDGRVLFELWNEPVYQNNDYSPDVGSKWTDLKPYYEELIQIIRNNDNTNVCLVTGNYWAYELRGIKTSLIADTNTAYTWHIYGGHSDNDPAKWAERLDELYVIRPVFVTEWGYAITQGALHYATPGTFANKFVRDFLDEKGLHNCAWGYDPLYEPNMLIGRSYNNLNPYGKFVVQYLQSKKQDWP
jgi:hypothetical protein